MSAADREIAPTNTDRYTPVSGLAITALVVGGTGAIAIVVLTIAARLAGKPAYQPILLVPALAGFLLAVAARWNIRHAQGARTGMGFANAAWWVSILSGGCFAAYMIASELAIRDQARAFTAKWLEKVATSPQEIAFLDTLEPAMRKSMDETQLAAIMARFGPALNPYREREVVRILERAGPNHEVRARGVRNWEHANNSYFVEQVFDVRTPEGAYSFLIPVKGQDARDAGGRAWNVLLNKTDTVDRSTTSLGRMIIDVQHESVRFTRDWVKKINDKQLETAYLDTLTLPDRQKWKENPGSAPGYEEFRNGSLVRVDGKEPNATDRARYGLAVLTPNGLNLTPGSAMAQPSPPNQKFHGLALTIDHMIELNAPGPVVANLRIGVEGHELLAEMQKLRGGDWKNNPIMTTTNAGGTLEVDRFPKRGYRILEINVLPKETRLGQPQMGNPSG